MRRPSRLQIFLIAAALLTTSSIIFLASGGRSPAQASIGGPFTLTRAEDGQSVTDRDFHGKYMLAYFGYTYCPDVCPTTLADLAAALKDLGAQADRIQPVFITVDPGRDTAKVLKPYLAQFSPRLVGLTGTTPEIEAVETAYKVYAAKEPTGTGPDDYVMDHSSFFYLMAPDGNFVTILPAGQDGKTLAAALKPYLEPQE